MICLKIIIFSFLVMIILFIKCYQSRKNVFCKLENNSTGICTYNGKYCPSIRNNSSECNRNNSHKRKKVCCSIFEKIVTPNNGVINFNQIETITTSQINNLINNNKYNIQSKAFSKCEDYKRRITSKTITAYVFGGSQSLAKEFPHMAALGYGLMDKIQWLCGGSLISENFILTAAHCVTSEILGSVTFVRLGDLNLNSNINDSNAQTFSVSQRIVHPGFIPPSLYNDIALLKLDRNVQFSEYIRPICLETLNYFRNRNFIASGWGKIDNSDKENDILMKVFLDYFPYYQCQQSYKDSPSNILPYGILDDTQICAGSFSGDRDTCQGDSGGPLQIKDDTYYLIGITSFGKECGLPNTPGVYTRVLFFLPWIENIVWTNY